CEVDGTQSQVVVVPHRRGDDGYLLLQLLPPSPEGNWQREVLPSGEPVDLLVLCDTSGSMDAAMRQTQSEFVAALLSSLGPKDRFNVAVSDVETTWLFPEPMTNTDDTLNQTREQLDQRVSLGWSNLEAMAAAALAKATSRTQIVYVGDGIVTGAQSDPQAFVTRLRVLTEQATANKQQFAAGPPTWHAISCGNTSEAVVLRAMSNLGHGSQRQITGEQPSIVVAHELLNEIMQPGLKDLQVEFRGVQVAAVYPERLPNLPAGMQQILVGRYLPTGSDQQGEVIITGRRGSEAVRYVAKIQFRDAEEGNSFIPRLWARSHLDQLQQQGSSAFLRDEIIRLSEDFHIITPYTSLLVLETDADRERFGVRKRYEMRDGERFFADGKASLRYDLAQQQMRQAEQWRLALRQRILADWARLGRDPQVFEANRRYDYYGRSAGRARSYRSLGTSSGGMLGRSVMVPALYAAEPAMAGIDLFFHFDSDAVDRLSLGDFSGERMEEELILAQSGVSDQSGFAPFGALGPAVYDAEHNLYEIDEKRKWDVSFDDNGRLAKEQLAVAAGFEINSPTSRASLALGEELFAGEAWGGGLAAAKSERFLRDGSDKQAYQSQPAVEWLILFPMVAAPPNEASTQRPPAWWTAEALALVQPLANSEALRQIAGGLEVRRTAQHFNEAWQRMTAAPPHLELYSPTAWLTRDVGQGQPTTIEWCDADERGALNLAMSTGRVRPAEKNDSAQFRSSLLVDPLETTYRQYIPTVARPAADRAVLALRHRAQSHVAMRLTIDTVRNAIVQVEHLDVDGKVTATESRSDFVEIAGLWFPTKFRTTTADGREMNVTTQVITTLEAAPFAARMATELAPRKDVLVLREPFPKLAAARRKLATGQPAVEDRIVVMFDATLRQQWDELFQQLTAIEQAAPEHPALRWLRVGLERAAGRNEEARQHLVAAAARLVGDESPEALARAQHVMGQAHAITGWHEFGEIVTQLRPVYARQADAAIALHDWKANHANVLRYTGRPEEFLALRKELATEVPGEIYEQTAYANLLAEFQQFDAAYAWLRQSLASPLFAASWKQNELRSAYVRLLRQQSRWTDLVQFCTEWTDKNPEDQTPYAELLSALLYANDIPRAEQLVRNWLTASHVDRPLTPAEIAWFNSAFGFTVGEIPHISSRGTLDPQWFGLLETTAKRFTAHAHHAEFATQIVSHHRFQQTDAADRVRGAMRLALNDRAATLPPATLQGLIAQCLAGRCLMVLGPNELKVEHVTREEWSAIAKTVRERWTAEKQTTFRRQLGDALLAIYSARFADTDYLPFLRERLTISATALADRGADPIEQLEPDDGQYVDQDRQALYDALLNRPWTDDIEQELFAMLPEFRHGDDSPPALFAAITRLQQLVDRLLAARIAAATQRLTDAAEAEKLTRTELQTKQRELQTAAKEGLADRLNVELANYVADAEFAAWLRMERATLDVQLNRNLDAALGECWELLGVAPPQFDPDAEFTPQQAAHEISQGVLRQRALAIVLHLASQPKASTELVTRVLGYLDAGVQQPGDRAAAWKLMTYQFLVALDRADDLERALHGWIAADPQAVEFQLALAKIRAERGDVPDAIARLEAVQRTTPLSPADLQLLSNLYLAVNRRADHERLRRQGFEQIPEWQLSNTISQLRGRLQNHTAEVDERLLDLLHALFAKASTPETYLWQLRDLYRTTRDFQLLRMVPDVTLGRTRERQYGILQSLDDQLLNQLKEAAADEILVRVRELRTETQTALQQATTDDVRAAKRLDLRALDLIEALVERRSSEVPNQGGPHAEAAVAALQRAFDGDWQPGERLQFAAVLKSFRHCSQPALATEQIRLLRELVRQADPDSDEGLQITSTLAHVLYWHYANGPVVVDARQEALALQNAAVRSVLANNGGRWPTRLWSVLEEYLGELREAQQYSTAEAVIAECLTKADTVEEREWFDERRLTLWTHALRHQGRVSLGEGAALFDALLSQAVRQIEQADDAHKHHRIVQTLSIFDAAFERMLPRAPTELDR
ncbi:MAG: hypothetical protein SH850_23980, partial [Planctomycetaceae bacterium]|nr:hypothetical protein [Planctomycetaceae bacterium]